MTVLTDINTNGIAVVTLNRPEVHNAFDDRLIKDLNQTLVDIAATDNVRVVVLTGAGASFSAGGDLKWMRSMVDLDESDNRADSLELARLMRTLNYLPKPTIARVNGAAFGGGVGLICCCDIAIGVDDARFGLTEVLLGLAPAVISPYVSDAIGLRQTRRLFQSAERIDAAEAHRIGLLHSVVSPSDLDSTVSRQVKMLLKAGPVATAAAKQLAFQVAGRDEASQQKLDQATSALIARLRISEEGQEGCNAFLEKRKASWNHV